MTKALDYIEKELGFQKIDINLQEGTIGEGDGEDYIFVHFSRKIVFKWASGYNPTLLIGKLTKLIGKLTKGEKEKIYKLDMAEYHAKIER